MENQFFAVKMCVFCLIALNIFVTRAIAQECNFRLSGIIYDGTNQQVLSGATVWLMDSDKIAVTNKSGVYRFNKLCSGTYRIKITHVGCVPIEASLVLNSDLQNQNFSLLHSAEQLSEVVVSSRYDTDVNSIKSSLTVEEMQKQKGGTLGEMLKQLSGVSVLQTGSTVFKPVIHGLHSQRVLILNNGVRQEGQQWGAEHAPEIDPLVASRLTVIKGAGALRYGSDAIGGAVLVEPRSLDIDTGLRVEVNSIYSSNNRMGHFNTIVEQGIKSGKSAWAWRSHLTYKRGGNARTPDYWLHNTGVQELNYSFHAGYQREKTTAEVFFSAFNTKIGIFWGAHIGNLTDLENAINSKTPLFNINEFDYQIARPSQDVSHYLIKAKLTQELSKDRRINFLLSHQENFRKEFDRSLIDNNPELDLNLGTTTADVHFETDRFANTNQQFGFTVQRQANVWSGSRFFLPNYTNLLLGLYAIRKWDKKDLQFEAGARYDYRSLEVFRNQNGQNSQIARQFNNLSSSFAINYVPNNNLSWLNNFSLAWRPPHVNELYVNGLHHGTANFEIGDPNLKSEISLKYTSQFNYQWNKDTKIDLTLYTNYIQNFINLVPVLPATLTLRGAFPTFQFKQADALLSGSDLTFNTALNPSWAYRFKASVLLPRNLESRTWLQQMPAPQIDQEVSWYFSPNKKSSYVSTNALWVAKQRFIPNNFIDYLAPPSDYLLFNLNFGTELRFMKTPVSLGASVFNLFNVRYRDYMNRFRYFSDEVGTNVVLRLKINL
jgi:iron complex outermembrane receptor protein